MSLIAVMRPPAQSTLACGALLAVWIAAAQLMTGRTSGLLHNMLDASIPFAAVFAAAGLVLYTPVFLLTGVLVRRAFTPALATLLGAVLAPAAYLAVAWTFRESQDPQTPGAFIRYWSTHLVDLALGALPFIVAGGLFGHCWSRQRERPAHPGWPQRKVA